MHSSAATYMASVSWTYPAAELVALKKQRTEADSVAAAVADTGVNIEQLALPLSHRGRRALEAAAGVR